MSEAERKRRQRAGWVNHSAWLHPPSGHIQILVAEGLLTDAQLEDREAISKAITGLFEKLIHRNKGFYQRLHQTRNQTRPRSERKKPPSRVHRLRRVPLPDEETVEWAIKRIQDQTRAGIDPDRRAAGILAAHANAAIKAAIPKTDKQKRVLDGGSAPSTIQLRKPRRK